MLEAAADAFKEAGLLDPGCVTECGRDGLAALLAAERRGASGRCVERAAASPVAQQVL